MIRAFRGSSSSNGFHEVRRPKEGFHFFASLLEVVLRARVNNQLVKSS